MKIVRSTYSCAAAGGSDEAREALRFGVIRARRNKPPPTANGRALIPQGVNSVKLRYANISAASLSKMMKPATGQGSNGTQAPGWADRSSTRERAQKDTSETWETRPDRRSRASRPEECITWGGVRRESDGLIVAGKRGNARGAKEPCCTHANIYERRAA